jgi:hypothetical protein
MLANILQRFSQFYFQLLPPWKKVNSSNPREFRIHLCSLCYNKSLISFLDNNSSYTGIFYILWIISTFISTCYTLTWDLKMDWGLLERNLSENTLLREEIVYPYKVRMTLSPFSINITHNASFVNKVCFCYRNHLMLISFIVSVLLRDCGRLHIPFYLDIECILWLFWKRASRVDDHNSCCLRSI